LWTTFLGKSLKTHRNHLSKVQIFIKIQQRQAEYEVVRVFWAKFQKLFYQIPKSYRPKGKYLVYLYTNGLQGHLSFLLNKENPKTLAEAHKMAIQIKKDLLSRTNTMDPPSWIRLLKRFAQNSQERREQVLDQ
jgi:hypothetical protein